jgi:hypothetical protein
MNGSAIIIKCASERCRDGVTDSEPLGRQNSKNKPPAARKRGLIVDF